VTCSKLDYNGWPNCQLITNGHLELVVTTDVGPRIIRCGFAGEGNLFYEPESDKGKSGGNNWRPYGGHRLWHAPEAKPRTYAPDNIPVPFEWTGSALVLKPQTEPSTGMGKEITIELNASNDTVRVAHRLTNHNVWPLTTAAWCLTVMTPGGRALVPQEPFVPFPDNLLPVRPLALWSYTNMSDPRFTWGERLIELRQDVRATKPQKFGVFNTHGWAAYENHGAVFLKRADVQRDRTYPDLGCNWEVYTNPAMLELESLGPMTELAPGESLEHVEYWSVTKHELPAAEGEAERFAALEAIARGVNQ
jgi:hypothetical protein